MTFLWRGVTLKEKYSLIYERGVLCIFQYHRGFFWYVMMYTMGFKWSNGRSNRLDACRGPIEMPYTKMMHNVGEIFDLSTL